MDENTIPQMHYYALQNADNVTDIVTYKTHLDAFRMFKTLQADGMHVTLVRVSTQRIMVMAVC